MQHRVIVIFLFLVTTPYMYGVVSMVRILLLTYCIGFNERYAILQPY